MRRELIENIKVYLNVNEVFVKSQMDGEKGYLEYR